MFILSILLLLLALFTVVVGFVAIEEGGFMPSVLGLAFLVIPVWLHNGDIVDRDMAYQVVAQHAELVDGLEKQMKSLPMLKGSFMNADTPYASISTQLTEAKKSLMQAKLSKIYAIKSIAKRRRGIVQYATWFDGE